MAMLVIAAHAHHSEVKPVKVSHDTAMTAPRLHSPNSANSLLLIVVAHGSRGAEHHGAELDAVTSEALDA
jgi:hypothetical protein